MAHVRGRANGTSGAPRATTVRVCPCVHIPTACSSPPYPRTIMLTARAHLISTRAASSVGKTSESNRARREYQEG
eukprot:5306442-Prymnesium_polylepis.1